MPDTLFEHPRLVEIYDALDPDRRDLDAYAAMAEEFGARRILDLGCGTGVFALLLAGRGLDVVGVDPARGSLDVAQRKPGSERVRWVHADASALPPVRVELATMTGNAAQAIVEAEAWDDTLRGVAAALAPGGRLVFETRDPARRAWRDWNREATYQRTEIPGAGTVEHWIDLLDVAGPLVRFRSNYRFAADGALLTSHSTLRFRERAEVEAALTGHGYLVDEVRAAPDRPGRELVFIARRPS